MIGIDRRGRIDLQAVVVLGRVLEQAIHGIEHFVRDQEEPFARHATVVETLFAFERQEQLPSQVVGVQLGYLSVRPLVQSRGGSVQLISTHLVVRVLK